MRKDRRLIDTYRFKGYAPSEELVGIFGDPKARVIELRRKGKKRYVLYARKHQQATTITRCGEYATYRVGTYGFIWSWKYAESIAGSVRR